MSPIPPFSRREFLLASASGLRPLQSLLAKTKGENWQVGCFTRPWADFDVLTCFDAVAKAGFRYLGLMTTAPDNRLVISVSTQEQEALRIGREAKSRGLIILSVYGGEFPVEQSLEAGVEGLRRLIALCAACGSKSLLLGGTEKAETFEAYYQAVARCCDEAMRQGIQLTVKPHGGLNATGPQCRKIIEKVGHRNFRLWYDPGNIFYYSDGQLDPVEDAANVDGLVSGMSVKDYQHPKTVDVTPGSGRVNFKAVLTRLKKGGFKSGPLLIECLKRGDLAALQNEAVKARQFLEACLKSI